MGESPEWFWFNMNDYVRVKLTEAGRRLHRKNHDDLFMLSIRPELRDRFPYRAPEEDSDGWSRWQLHDLIREFHSGIYMGVIDLPFETWFQFGKPEFEPPAPVSPQDMLGKDSTR